MSSLLVRRHGKTVVPVNFRDHLGQFEENPDCDDEGNCLDPCIIASVVSIFDPSPGCGPIGVGGPPDEGPPESPDCLAGFAGYQVDFVIAHYTDSVALGKEAGIPSTWILGWSAEESGWGGATSTPIIDRNPNNYFSWTGKGDAPCPEGASTAFGCFTSYSAAATTALFSANNYFKYKRYPRHVGVTAGAILLSEYKSGSSAAKAFDALSATGYAKDPKYGAKVSNTVSTVTLIQNCLGALGRLP